MPDVIHMHKNFDDSSCTYLRKQLHIFKFLECDLLYHLKDQVLHYILHFFIKY